MSPTVLWCSLVNFELVFCVACRISQSNNFPLFIDFILNEKHETLVSDLFNDGAL